MVLHFNVMMWGEIRTTLKRTGQINQETKFGNNGVVSIIGSSVLDEYIHDDFSSSLYWMGQMKLSSFNREMNMTIDFSDAHNKFDVDSHKCVAFWHSLLCFGKNCRRKDCCRQHLLLLLLVLLCQWQAIRQMLRINTTFGNTILIFLWFKFTWV